MGLLLQVRSPSPRCLSAVELDVDGSTVASKYTCDIFRTKPAGADQAHYSKTCAQPNCVKSTEPEEEEVLKCVHSNMTERMLHSWLSGRRNRPSQ